ncbi:MAG: right-handed parallel beta-helix repeat-containing protein, partial [Planctomycetota bacterium]
VGNTSDFSGIVTAAAGSTSRGTVFEDVDFAGVASDWDGGLSDAALANVDVEIYSNTDVYISSTNTALDGSFGFAGSADGTYKIRVRSATIGDGNTPPVGGFVAACGVTDPASGPPCTLAELTWAAGSPLIGGQDPLVDDTATANNAGIGDTYVTVTLSGSDVANVNFGVAYTPIVSTNDSGQGSLRQFLKNANDIAGTQTSRFVIPISDPDYNTVIANAFVIQPATALPVLSDDGTSIDGTTQEATQGDLRPGLPDIVLDGVNLGTDDHGLELQASNCTVRKLELRRFNNGSGSGSGTGILIDGAAGGGDLNVITDNYLTLNSNTTGSVGAISVTGPADGNTIDNNTISGNFSDGIRFATSDSNGNSIANNSIANNGDDGVKLSGDTISFTGNTVTSNQQVVAFPSCGVEIVSATNSLVANNVVTNNGDQGGVCIADFASSGNTIGPANTITGHGGPGIYSTIAGSVANRFTQNSISGNTGLGIDLELDGVTANDGGDGDSGPNDLLNFPVITSAVESGGTVTVDFDSSSATRRLTHRATARARPSSIS